MTVGALAPGVAPDAVIPAATGAAGEYTVVEGSSINVVAGEARLTARFTCDDDEIALQIAGAVVDAVAELAAVAKPHVTRRVGNRWPVIG